MYPRHVLKLLLVYIFCVSVCLARTFSKPREREELTQNERVYCRDEAGYAVPWFVAYKLPKMKTAGGSTFKRGTGYSYILPGFTRWKQSEKAIGNKDSIVGQTIRPFYTTPNDIAYIVYNDQPPYRDDFGYNGHAKGMILTKKNGGLWLIHSVPKFPLVGESFFPDNGMVNAQMFLCLSLTTSQIDSVGNVFKLTRPHVSNVSMPGSFTNSFPILRRFLSIKRFSSKLPSSDIINIRTGELDFQIFAKSPKFGKEIYSEWLAPTLKSSLEVQSWLNGINAFTSNCSHEYTVSNIIQKKIEGEDFTRNDHSKWAVGSGDKNPWTCISDLNRMEGQKTRGGAALCTSNSKLWEAFNSAIVDLQPCPRQG